MFGYLPVLLWSIMYIITEIYRIRFGRDTLRLFFAFSLFVCWSFFFLQTPQFYIFLSFFLNYCAVWVCIVAFTKVLMIYQIHHSWILPLQHYPSSPSLHYWNSYNRYHFSIYIHVYTVFALYSLFYDFPHLFSFPLVSILPGRIIL
jgi:hypothetical protein